MAGIPRHSSELVKRSEASAYNYTPLAPKFGVPINGQVGAMPMPSTKSLATILKQGR